VGEQVRRVVVDSQRPGECRIAPAARAQSDDSNARALGRLDVLSLDFEAGMTEPELEPPSIPDMEFSGADLRRSDFRGANMKGAPTYAVHSSSMRIALRPTSATRASITRICADELGTRLRTAHPNSIGDLHPESEYPMTARSMVILASKQA
jgi:hypothetical protein